MADTDAGNKAELGRAAAGYRIGRVSVCGPRPHPKATTRPSWDCDHRSFAEIIETDVLIAKAVNSQAHPYEMRRLRELCQRCYPPNFVA